MFSSTEISYAFYGVGVKCIIVLFSRKLLMALLSSNLYFLFPSLYIFGTSLRMFK